MAYAVWRIKGSTPLYSSPTRYIAFERQDGQAMGYHIFPTPPFITRLTVRMSGIPR